MLDVSIVSVNDGQILLIFQGGLIRQVRLVLQRGDLQFLFGSCSIVGFWVVTAYVKGMYVVCELIIEELYINPL